EQVRGASRGLAQPVEAVPPPAPPPRRGGGSVKYRSRVRREQRNAEKASWRNHVLVYGYAFVFWDAPWEELRVRVERACGVPLAPTQYDEWPAFEGRFLDIYLSLMGKPSAPQKLHEPSRHIYQVRITTGLPIKEREQSDLTANLIRALTNEGLRCQADTPYPD